jgi:hypothetical protein
MGKKSVKNRFVVLLEDVQHELFFDDRDTATKFCMANGIPHFYEVDGTYGSLYWLFGEPLKVWQLSDVDLQAGTCTLTGTPWEVLVKEHDQHCCKKKQKRRSHGQGANR